MFGMVPWQQGTNYLRLQTNKVNIVESGNAATGWKYTGAVAGFNNGGTFDKQFANFGSGDGTFEFTVSNVITTPFNSVVGLDANTWVASVGVIKYGIWVHQDGHYYTANANSYVSTGVIAATGDVIRLTKTGSTVKWEKFNGTWSTIYIYSNVTQSYCRWILLNVSNAGATANNFAYSGLI